MKTRLTLSVIFLFAAGSLQAQTDTMQAELVSRQFAFTEGPAPDKQGNIYFTDQPNDQIWKYDTDGKLSLFMDKAGRSNGLYFDKKGNIIACADEHNEMWSIAPDGKKTVMITDYHGRKLNGPNDLWITKKGVIYFTDPYYQRNYWTRQQPDIQEQRVYFLPKGSKTPVIATDNIKKPNGIVGSKDGKYIYVADIGASKIYKYKIQKDGTLGDRQLFTDQLADGITTDEQGNIYTCGNGVSVYNPEGKLIRYIKVPEKWSANACFGGKGRDILFITASTSVYIVKMPVKGVE